MNNECDRDPFPTAHNPAPTDNERHESSSVTNTEETEFCGKNSVSFHHRRLLYHPRVQYIRTLLFIVDFRHFFHFVPDFTAKTFRLKNFRMRSVPHDPPLHFAQSTDLQA